GPADEYTAQCGCASRLVAGTPGLCKPARPGENEFAPAPAAYHTGGGRRLQKDPAAGIPGQPELCGHRRRCTGESGAATGRRIYDPAAYQCAADPRIRPSAVPAPGGTIQQGSCTAYRRPEKVQKNLRGRPQDPGKRIRENDAFQKYPRAVGKRKRAGPEGTETRLADEPL